jgi:hypothetical protein
MRKLLTILCVIGFVGSVGLWGLSYWSVAYLAGTKTKLGLWSNLVTHESSEGYAPMPNEVILHLRRGCFEWETDRSLSSGLGIYPRRLIIAGYSGIVTHWLPSLSITTVGTGGGTLPLWMPCVLFVSIVAIEPYSRHYRRRHNLCVRCAYNLEGLTEGRCPECNMRREP